MHPSIRLAHETLWSRFFCDEENLFYDLEFTDSSQFPTREEVAASIPNSAGWCTGMEDCCLAGGWILDGLLCAHRVSGEHEWAEKARKVFKGLVALGTVSKTPGFIARAFAPGRRDIYPNSSTDQYTSFVYGMWRYANSPVASTEERETATRLVLNATRLVESFGDDIPREDMRPSLYGETGLIEPDRACRLLQFYKAANVLSGDDHWHDVYMRKVEEHDRARIRKHYGPEPFPPEHHMWAVFQSQAAWRLLFETEADSELRGAYREALNAQAVCAMPVIDTWREIVKQPLQRIIPDRWRDFYEPFCLEHPEIDMQADEASGRFMEYMARHAEDIPPRPEALARTRPTMPTLLEQVQAVGVGMLAEDPELKREAAEKGWPMFSEVDWSLMSESAAVRCLEGAYWRGVEAGLFPAG